MPAPPHGNIRSRKSRREPPPSTLEARNKEIFHGEVLFEHELVSFLVILLLAGGPEDGVRKNLREGRIIKMFGAMAHEDVNVSGFHVIIRPDHRVIAHLLVGWRGIGLFIDTGEHMDFRPW